uniref:Uncharacterized protein n=1 Tax=Micrurus carvalhoi TaxID=3147026 RepID=A0A2H6N0Q4_9SAUR
MVFLYHSMEAKIGLRNHSTKNTTDTFDFETRENFREYYGWPLQDFAEGTNGQAYIIIVHTHYVKALSLEKSVALGMKEKKRTSRNKFNYSSNEYTIGRSEGPGWR